jgi:hypothetical protein
MRRFILHTPRRHIDLRGAQFFGSQNHHIRVLLVSDIEKTYENTLMEPHASADNAGHQHQVLGIAMA